jgi:predicted Zn finger-like uncharacterized protein
MILKCSYCSGKMRVDDARLPVGRAVKVRCPHCKGIGLTARKAPAVPAESMKKAAPLNRVESIEPPAQPAESRSVEFSPEPDVSDEFRFPSEREAEPERGKTRGTWPRVLVWVGASLAIILAFALIVNLVLTGPPR